MEQTQVDLHACMVMDCIFFLLSARSSERAGALHGLPAGLVSGTVIALTSIY